MNVPAIDPHALPPKQYSLLDPRNPKHKQYNKAQMRANRKAAFTARHSGENSIWLYNPCQTRKWLQFAKGAPSGKGGGGGSGRKIGGNFAGRARHADVPSQYPLSCVAKCTCSGGPASKLLGPSWPRTLHLHRTAHNEAISSRALAHLVSGLEAAQAPLGYNPPHPALQPQACLEHFGIQRQSRLGHGRIALKQQRMAYRGGGKECCTACCPLLGCFSACGRLHAACCLPLAACSLLFATCRMLLDSCCPMKCRVLLSMRTSASDLTR